MSKKRKPEFVVPKGFLTDLAKVSMKYGIAIGGCGCCGSPFLYRTTKSGSYVLDQEDAGKLTFKGEGE